jgi:hypothetical protein
LCLRAHPFVEDLPLPDKEEEVDINELEEY